MKLYKHQQEAIDFAVSNNGRCALFHDPGLGKTRTGLEIFRHYRSKKPGLKLLVVCPFTLVVFRDSCTLVVGFSFCIEHMSPN